MSKTIYLVDASTFIHRSYHAIRNLSTRDGRPTNAVFGFVATLTKLLREKSPEYLLVAYDAKGPTFRKDLYPDYKANRPPMPEDLVAQQEPIREIVAALGLKSKEVEGLEADDIVATMTARARARDFDVVIVSSDKDYYQLLGPTVSMYDPNPKRESAMTLESLREKFGLTPHGFLEAQGLMGDSSDNIPGVPGVGEKTAVKLVQEFENLEKLYKNLDKVPRPKLRAGLEEHRDQAFLSRDLAKLKTDADLGLDMADLTVGEPDAEALKDIYRDLEFTRFLNDLGTEKNGPVRRLPPSGHGRGLRRGGPGADGRGAVVRGPGDHLGASHARGHRGPVPGGPAPPRLLHPRGPPDVGGPTTGLAPGPGAFARAAGVRAHGQGRPEYQV